MLSKIKKPSYKANKVLFEVVFIVVLFPLSYIIALLLDLYEKLSDLILVTKSWRFDEVIVTFLVMSFAVFVFSIRRWLELRQEVNIRKKTEALLTGQNQVFEMLAKDHPLKEVLTKLIELIENHSPGSHCSILFFNPETRTLHVGAAPHLPSNYLQAIEGSSIGPFAGSCGTACFKEQSVFVSDIANDPLWADYRDLALQYNLRACWCIPIFSSQNTILGTFAMYFREPKVADDSAVHLLEIATHISSLAITRQQSATVLENHTRQLESLLNQNGRLIEQLHHNHASLQTLSHQLVKAQEAERRHIARELHDEVGQSLTAIKINLQVVQKEIKINHNQVRLDESIRLTEQTLQQVRDISLNLRPSMLDDLGLVSAMRWYIDKLVLRTHLTIHLISNINDAYLSADLKTICFRIMQESLTNVLRHAYANQVIVSLKLEGNNVVLTIQDDGVGFDLEKTLYNSERGASLGLVGMQERAALVGGKIDFLSGQSSGCKITATLPVEEISMQKELVQR